MPINSPFLSSFWTMSSNFGDVLGPWLTRAISKKPVVYVESKADLEHFVCGGSILNWAGPKAVVWGAGLGTMTDGVGPCNIRAVRGPFSRQRALSCGALCPRIYGEPALLLPRFYKPCSTPTGLGIVPHYVDQYRVNSWWLGQYKIIDVLQPVEKVIDEIVSCNKIISSSLHGLIVAHAYGIPAAWAKFSDSIGGDGIKYHDYLASVGVEVDGPCDMRNGEMKVPEFTEAKGLEGLTRRLWDSCPFLP